MSLYYVPNGALACSFRNDGWKILGPLRKGDFVIIIKNVPDEECFAGGGHVAFTKFGLCCVSIHNIKVIK